MCLGVSSDSPQKQRGVSKSGTRALWRKLASPIRFDRACTIIVLSAFCKPVYLAISLREGGSSSALRSFRVIQLSYFYIQEIVLNFIIFLTKSGERLTKIKDL